PSGNEYQSRSQAVGQLDGLTLPGQQFLFTADTTGWFSLVVWHNVPAKDDTARYFVGLNTASFGLPMAVELSGFAAQAGPDSITLKWRTETGTNLYRWLIERSTAPEAGYQLVGIMAARENSGTPCEYSWTDRDLTDGQRYYYRLGRQETDGKVNYFGPVSATALLKTFSLLMEVSPNPFKQRASIVYQVAEPNTVVSLGVYNIAGQLVRGIQQEILPPGRYSWLWDGCNGRGSRVPAGCYLVKAEIGKHRILRKIVRLP
ncbi:MAG: FlgD immunoglobulin-like domain containing protein, partial [Deltaproteobacteria bacterium]|nr:FlgD immunoglobulin-like domain containing protein [Deltaproteobacteria bacterium]